MGNRILITGASGSVGGALLAQLKAQLGDDPRASSLTLVAASRSPAQREAFAAQGVETVALDYADAASVSAAMQNIDQLFLCTGYTIDMLVHSKLALDAARDGGVKQVVHLGALGPKGSKLPHFVWHEYVEAYVAQLGFQHTFLRPRAFMQNVLATLRPGSTVLRHFGGPHRMGWIDVDDIARVAAEALLDGDLHHGKGYPLSEDSLSMDEVAAVIAQVTGLLFRADAKDTALLLPALLKTGMDPTYADSLARGTAATARGEAADAANVYGTVQQVTGRPGTRWADFARIHRARLMQPAPAPSNR
ncbi:MAG: NmrA family NAD(P)-binding protein [Burkholderiaceae bacterium]|nr:NmrA family NAD(P)-binding protein [Burkholderiaceae bacterium]